MCAKRKNNHHNTTPAHRTNSGAASKRQLAQARQAHAKGTMGVEDFIWTAMQCYAADARAGHKANNRFA
jgi:hypothetical protein